MRYKHRCVKLQENIMCPNDIYSKGQSRKGGGGGFTALLVIGGAIVFLVAAVALGIYLFRGAGFGSFSLPDISWPDFGRGDRDKVDQGESKPPDGPGREDRRPGSEDVGQDAEGHELVPGRMRTGRIDAPGQSQSYSFRSDSSMFVTISVSKRDGTLDPLVELYDGSGRPAGKDDDGGAGLNARLTTPVTRGTYDVVVRGHGSSTGGYEISLEKMVPDRIEKIRPEESLAGSLDRPGEVHTYRFQLKSPMRIEINLVDADGSFDPELELFNEFGRMLGRDDDGGEGRNSRLTQSLAPGGYTVMVRGHSASTGDYRLILNRWKPDRVGTIRTGQSRTGRIDRSGEVHAYNFRLRTSRRIEINLENTDGSFDPELELLDAEGLQIGKDDDGGNGFNSRLTERLARGAYTIIVKGHGLSTGEYVVSLSRAR